MIFSIILDFSKIPVSMVLTPGILLMSSAAISFASLSSPAIKQSQSMSSGMLDKWELLMLQNAQITFAPVPSRMDAVLSAAEPSIRSMNLNGFPPIAVSNGTVASNTILSVQNSLIPSTVGFCAARGTVRIKMSPSFAASSFAKPLMFKS